VHYNGSRDFDQTKFNLIVYPESDYKTIEVNCSVSNNTLPCKNFSTEILHCSPTFSFSGDRGCDYSCVFTTVKHGYLSVSSHPHNLSISKYQSFQRIRKKQFETFA